MTRTRTRFVGNGLLIARASLLAMASCVLTFAACKVEDTLPRCSSQDDCAGGQECYLGYCVLQEQPDAGRAEKTGATATTPDAGKASMRRTGSSRAGAGANDNDAGVSLGESRRCGAGANDDDAGVAEGACCTEAQPCYDGPKGTQGVGRCKPGRRACVDGRLGACEGGVLPRAEACDNEGADDDCDGKMDNVPDKGKACTPTGAKTCGPAMLLCVSGEKALQCREPSPPPEMCNKKDDDCDGKVDETFDLQKDPKNCGACGTSCASDQACCGGSCGARVAGTADGCPQCSATKACDSGKTCCAGACADFNNDRNNCGSCGTTCGGREECCGGKCIDTRRDKNNCGGCGTVCNQGASATCCNSSCVDVSTDERNCGQCGNVCSALCSCDASNGQAPACRAGLFCF